MNLDPEFDATPYRKADGQWYVLRKIDRTNFIEKPASEQEIADAKEVARAKLAAFDEPAKTAKVAKAPAKAAKPANKAKAKK